jgi:hypothetical protein
MKTISMDYEEYEREKKESYEDGKEFGFLCAHMSVADYLKKKQPFWQWADEVPTDSSWESVLVELGRENEWKDYIKHITKE